MAQRFVVTSVERTTPVALDNRSLNKRAFIASMAFGHTLATTGSTTTSVAEKDREPYNARAQRLERPRADR